MPNRWVRDEIIHQALDLLQGSTLEAHDRKEGVVLPNAYMIKWLGNALDTFHRAFPFQGDVTFANVTIQANQEKIVLTADTTKNLPDDFSATVRDGLLVQISSKWIRLRERGFQEWFQSYFNNLNATGAIYPKLYAYHADAIQVSPKATASLAGQLWYYKLPAVLSSNHVPKFPDDDVLVDYLRIRGMEWLRAPSYPIGSAKAFAEQEISKLRQSGLLGNTGFDVMPIEGAPYMDEVVDNFMWMGPWIF